MTVMQTDYVQFRFPVTPESQSNNRAALREGVAECVDSGSNFELKTRVPAEQVDAAMAYFKTIARGGRYLGGYEFYANGALNLYVREGKIAIGIIRVRP